MARPVDLRRHAHCKIYLNGNDITNRLEPYLISVVVMDKKEGFDECAIELDDRDGRLEIPPHKGFVQIFLGWQSTGPRVPPVAPAPPIPPGGEDELQWEGTMDLMFQGVIVSIESGFYRKGGGRRLWIEANSADPWEWGKVRALKSWSEGEVRDSNGALAGGVLGGPDAGTTLGQVLAEAGAAAGFVVRISPEMANIRRDYWYQNESFFNFATRLARELGGVAKWQGNELRFYKNGDPLGQLIGVEGPWPQLEAEWGKNLIAWRLKPYSARTDWKEAGSEWWDHVNATWHEAVKQFGGEQSIPFGLGSAIFRQTLTVPNENDGDQMNNGSMQQSLEGHSVGYVTINGEPTAKAMRRITLKGCRPGVDGRYEIVMAEHTYRRDTGYITRCELGRAELIESHFPHHQKIGDLTEVERFRAGLINQFPELRNLPENITEAELRDLLRRINLALAVDPNGAAQIIGALRAPQPA